MIQTFFIRVAAIGDVAAQQVNPTGDPPDNTNWSGVIEVVPADQPPSSPGPVSLYVLDGSTLQVIITLLPHNKLARTKTPTCEASVSVGTTLIMAYVERCPHREASIPPYLIDRTSANRKGARFPDMLFRSQNIIGLTTGTMIPRSQLEFEVAP